MKGSLNYSLFLNQTWNLSNVLNQQDSILNFTQRKHVKNDIFCNILNSEDNCFIFIYWIICLLFVQQYKLKNLFKVIFPAILMNSWKFTWTKKNPRGLLVMLVTNSMYLVNIYLGGKLTIQMLKRLKLLSLLKFPNIFHDVFLKSYF